jgi:hypothetical protein
MTIIWWENRVESMAPHVIQTFILNPHGKEANLGQHGTAREWRGVDRNP